MPTATRLPTDLSVWPPTTIHYALDDGTWILVEADFTGPTDAMKAYLHQIGSDTAELVPQPMIFNQRPTLILPANQDGLAVSLNPLHILPPGTTHTDALTQAGYTVQET